MTISQNLHVSGEKVRCAFTDPLYSQHSKGNNRVTEKNPERGNDSTMIFTHNIQVVVCVKQHTKVKNGVFEKFRNDKYKER